MRSGSCGPQRREMNGGRAHCSNPDYGAPLGAYVGVKGQATVSLTPMTAVHPTFAATSGSGLQRALWSRPGPGAKWAWHPWNKLLEEITGQFYLPFSTSLLLSLSQFFAPLYYVLFFMYFPRNLFVCTMRGFFNGESPHTFWVTNKLRWN